MAQKDQIIYKTMKTIEERTGRVLLNHPFQPPRSKWRPPMVETPLTRETAITLAIYVYYIYDNNARLTFKPGSHQRRKRKHNDVPKRSKHFMMAELFLNLGKIKCSIDHACVCRYACVAGENQALFTLNQ